MTKPGGALSPAALAAGYRRIAVTGLSKNAGKTTVLGRLAAAFSGERMALSSVGLDGETVDLVTGTGKPLVRAEAGTLVASAEKLLPLCSATREILDLTDLYTPLGRVAVFRTLDAGSVLLGGPSDVAQMARLSERLVALGAERLLLDGAVSRRSLARPALCDGAVLCAGAAFAPDMARVVSEAAYAARCMTLPVTGEDAPAVLAHGAVTDATVDELLAAYGEPGELSAADPTRLLLSQAAFLRLTRAGWRVSVRARPALLFIAANPTSPYGGGFPRDAFLSTLAQAVDVPVFDGREL